MFFRKKKSTQVKFALIGEKPIECLNQKKSIGASGEMTIEEAKELIQHLVNNNHDFDLHYEAKENKLSLIGKSDM